VTAAEEDLEAILGHRFGDRGLLETALTHPSFAGGRSAARHYERMEFLGDRVLGLVIAAELYGTFPDAPAGSLALRYNGLVRREAASEVAREIGLGAFLHLGPAERQSGIEERDTVLGDAMEAVIGALYLDGGLESARRFVLQRWASRIALAAGTEKDAKNRLQERLSQSGAVPLYNLVAQSGPDHAPLFEVEVTAQGLPASAASPPPAARASGRSRRTAEQAAASELLRLLDARR